MRIFAGVCAVTVAIVSTSCGSSSTTAPTTGSGSGSGGTSSTTITITSTGVSPKNLTVTRGAQVTFVNNDTRPHEMYSDPHPDHTDCPELNQVGHLEPGQSRQSGNLVIARVCGYHDHINPDITSLQGNITIQ
jgi:plastocyanin